jgi:hypothetical protein
MQNNFNNFTRLFLLTLLISGCSSTSFSDLFTGYTQQMHAVKVAQQQGSFQQAISVIPLRSPNDGTYSLSILEKARLSFLANDFESSQKAFAIAYKNVEEQQQAAKIQLSRSIEHVGAVLSNDNATRYDIPLYEQSMLHSYQALNYLYQEDLSGALVEVRRANLVQQNALTANQDSIERHQQAMTEQGLSMGSLSNKYPSMDATIGHVKNSFQNAYTFYLSAVLYEASGKYNDAYIDYKKALEITPKNSYLQNDVWRLAKKLHMTSDINQFEKYFPSVITKKAFAGNQGEVVIIVEQGIIAPKQEVAINLPLFTRHNDVRFYSFALPSYQNNLQSYSPLQMTYQGKSYISQEITRLQSLAAKQLKDDLPLIITRQVARVIAKEELRKQMKKQGGDIGNILAGFYNIATEKADTRSWGTLPDSIHILRMQLPAGEHSFNLNINGVTRNIDLTVNERKQTLVKLTALGAFTDYKIHNL